MLESHDPEGSALRSKLDRKNLERLFQVAKAKYRGREHRHEF
jgi:hypothetical protein